jgi:hypothetical protein
VPIPWGTPIPSGDAQSSFVGGANVGANFDIISSIDVRRRVSKNVEDGRRLARP